MASVGIEALVRRWLPGSIGWAAHGPPALALPSPPLLGVAPPRDPASPLSSHGPLHGQAPCPSLHCRVCTEAPGLWRPLPQEISTSVTSPQPEMDSTLVGFADGRDRPDKSGNLVGPVSVPSQLSLLDCL